MSLRGQRNSTMLAKIENAELSALRACHTVNGIPALATEFRPLLKGRITKLALTLKQPLPADLTYICPRKNTRTTLRALTCRL
jgi:hypothetical protein